MFFDSLARGSLLFNATLWQRRVNEGAVLLHAVNQSVDDMFLAIILSGLPETPDIDPSTIHPVINEQVRASLHPRLTARVSPLASLDSPIISALTRDHDTFFGGYLRLQNDIHPTVGFASIIAEATHKIKNKCLFDTITRSMYAHGYVRFSYVSYNQFASIRLGFRQKRVGWDRSICLGAFALTEENITCDVDYEARFQSI